MFIASLLVNAVGILLFLFIFWRRLKEDFASEIIFRIGFHILLGVGIAVLVSLNFFHSFFLWMALFGGVVGLIFSIYRIKIKFYETFEAFIIASLPWLSVIFLQDSVIHSSLSSFLGFLGILFLLFVSYYLDANYKNFSWYKSGKIGFSGLTVLCLIFLIRFALALLGITMLSFVGQIFELVATGLGIITCLVMLFNLGRTYE